MMAAADSRERIVNLACTIFIVFVIGFAFTYGFLLAITPVARHVPSEPYVWPGDCQKFVATDSDGTRHYAFLNVPRSCMDPRYHIADPWHYGLRYHRGGNLYNYYRIGPDAVNIDCLNDGRCMVNTIERDVFTEAYEWSGLCPKAVYKEGSSIPGACEQDKYRLGARDYDLKEDSADSIQFYRIGNDLMGIQCEDAMSTHCIVKERLPGAFDPQSGFHSVHI